MKQFILSLLVMLGTTLAINAQEGQPANPQATSQQRVFQQIYNKSFKTANDTKESMTNRKTAAFRADAVNYLSNKTLSEITDTTRHLTGEQIASLNNQLDSMAYFMYDYVNLFNKEYNRAKTQKDKAKILKIFREVSINNPLYNDPDRQFVLSYYNREDFLTQFSLDTNWVKAVAEVKERLKNN